MNWTALVEDYLKQRRQLGYLLTIDGRQLLNFARFAEQQKATLPLTVTLARNWGSAAPSGSPFAMARRVALLRPFSRYLNAFDPANPVLPSRLMGPTHRRLPPYIYSKEEIYGLMTACDSLFSLTGLRPNTIRTLIGLLVSTGLRPGEAVRLQDQHVNLQEGELIINNSKGWHSRLVPLSTSCIVELEAYRQRRNDLLLSTVSSSFFVTDDGKSLDIGAADYSFGLLRADQGLNRKNNGRRPRLYDLRHTFVCNRLLAWYESNEPVDCLIPQLSQYIGHKKVSDTYWYIQSVPTLMSIAAKRFEHHQKETGGVQ